MSDLVKYRKNSLSGLEFYQRDICFPVAGVVAGLVASLFVEGLLLSHVLLPIVGAGVGAYCAIKFGAKPLKPLIAGALLGLAASFLVGLVVSSILIAIVFHCAFAAVGAIGATGGVIKYRIAHRPR